MSGRHRVGGVLGATQNILRWADRPSLFQCWEWTGTIDRDGYGQSCIDGKTTRAHRLSYELFQGEIPEGLTLDHLCRNRACVNPYHLEPVTNQENARRARPEGGITHCKHGHEYTPENTFWNIGRYERVRNCRTCRQIRDRARQPQRAQRRREKRAEDRRAA